MTRKLPPVLCGCGCGKTLSKRSYTYAQGHEAPGSRNRVRRPYCACGCGERVTDRQYQYRKGHRPLLSRMNDKTVLNNSGCWVWQGKRVPHGYGQVWNPSSERQEYVHRVSWMIHRGPIPESMQVLHHCDNPPCWNPDHLWLGTQQDNMADMIAKGRSHSQRLAAELALGNAS